MADIADAMLGSFGGAYKLGRQLSSDAETKRNATEMKNVFQEVMSHADEYGGQEGALREASKRFGQSGNIAGFETVMKMAGELQKNRQAFQQQLAPGAAWILMGPKEERESKYSMFREQGKALGIDLPEKMDETQLTKFLGLDNAFKVFEEGYKSTKSAAETRKLEEEARTSAKHGDLYEAQKGYYERRPGASTTGKSGDKSLSEKQASDFAKAQERWDNMTADEKEELQFVNSKEYERLNQMQAMYRDDPRIKAIRNKSAKKASTEEVEDWKTFLPK